MYRIGKKLYLNKKRRRKKIDSRIRPTRRRREKKIFTKERLVEMKVYVCWLREIWTNFVKSRREGKRKGNLEHVSNVSWEMGNDRKKDQVKADSIGIVSACGKEWDDSACTCVLYHLFEVLDLLLRKLSEQRSAQRHVAIIKTHTRRERFVVVVLCPRC